MRTSQTVDRVADVLEVLAAAGRPVGVTELAQRLGVHKATASRLMATLAQRGLVRRAHGGYRLGPALARLATLAVSELELVALGRPVLQDLVESTGEAAYLAVPHEGSVLYVDQRTPHRARVASDWTGRRSPLFCSSSGKVFAAYGAFDDLDAVLPRTFVPMGRRSLRTAEEFRKLLPRVRRQGYAISTDEQEDGLSSVAAPVLGAAGEVVAALGLAVPSPRYSHAGLVRLGSVVASAAEVVARRMRQAGPPDAGGGR